MVHARRAVPEAPEVTTSTSGPRRGDTSRIGVVFRRSLAPTAIVGLLMATTALTFVPFGAHESTSVADPLAAYDERVANRASREFTRVPVKSDLPAVLYSPSPTPKTVPSPTPSPSVTAIPTTSAPAPTATSASPEVVAPVESTPVESTPVETTPAVDWNVEGTAGGPRWSTASVNVRTGPGTEFDVISAVAEGRGLTITDETHDGWQQVSLKSGAGWIKASFLTEQEPAPRAPPASSAPSSSSASSSTSSSSSGEETAVSSSAGQCAKAGNATSNMTSRTVSVLNQVCAQFSSITSYGGYRAGSGGYHGSGQAIDAMVSGEAGWEVARWVRANASSLGVVEVIYAQQIWTSQRSGDGWRSMSDRGSASANHYDHVHISVS